MKYLKTFGLALIAALTLTAFVGAGSASATVICKTNTTPCSEKYPAGTEYKASLAIGTSMRLTTTEGTTLNTCTAATLTGKTENLGSATETVRGPVAATGLTFSNCVSGTVTTTEGGVTETHSISGTSNGTYTAKNFKISVGTVFGTCVYTAGTGTHIGTVTGGAPATVDVAAVVSLVSGFCPSSAKWAATYTVTSPNPLYVKES
jgi:hypothetical protein